MLRDAINAQVTLADKSQMKINRFYKQTILISDKAIRLLKIVHSHLSTTGHL